MQRRGQILLLAAILPICMAVGFEEIESGSQPRKFAPDRKTPSMFHRAEKGSPEKQLARARSHLTKGRVPWAVAAYEALVHTWHSSKEASTAQLEYAVLLEDRGRYEDAFGEFQYLVEHFQGRFAYDEVLDHQFKIANQVMRTKTRQFFFFPADPDRELALRMFKVRVANGPYRANADHAQYSIGLLHEQLESYREAIVAYERVYQLYPKSELATQARFKKGECLYVLAEKSQYDEYSQLRARQHVSLFIKDHPEHESAAVAKLYEKVINERLADMHYKRAVFYDKKMTKPKAALIAYTDFLNKYSDVDKAVAARARVKELKAVLGEDVEDETK